MYATVHGVQLAYSDVGPRTSTAVLLVHGFPLNRSMWRSQLRSLGRQYRVLAPDLRGQGWSGNSEGDYSMDRHADDLAGLLDHLGVERVALGGLSMGGYVAFAFWRRHADRLLGLMLLDTRAEAESPEGRARRDSMMARAREAGTRAIASDMLPRLLAPRNLADARLVARVLAIASRSSTAGLVKTLAGMRDRPDSLPDLARTQVPVLVLVGAEDQIVSEDDARALAAAMPHAQQITIPAAGHLCPMENPRQTNKALRAFLRSLSDSNPFDAS